MCVGCVHRVTCATLWVCIAMVARRCISHSSNRTIYFSSSVCVVCGNVLYCVCYHSTCKRSWKRPYRKYAFPSPRSPAAPGGWPAGGPILNMIRRCADLYSPCVAFGIINFSPFICILDLYFGSNIGQRNYNHCEMIVINVDIIVIDSLP